MIDKTYVPDGVSIEEACSRVTHMAIGAHQDDLEIFAYHGIAACYRSSENWFAGVTVTDGGGSARIGPYQGFTDLEMRRARYEEQNRAADLGEYSLQVQLGFPSSEVKDTQGSMLLVEELYQLLFQCRPHTLYLHNPADKHDTHIATLARCLTALRRLPVEARPERIYGCEVWRDLDWVPDELKIALPVDAYPELAESLIAVFDSQVAGGKNYVRATLGRRQANATFFQSHHVDQANAYTFALDLRPLLDDDTLSLERFAQEYIDAFGKDVASRIQKFDR